MCTHAIILYRDDKVRFYMRRIYRYAGKRIPILYEAYYPEPREWVSIILYTRTLYIQRELFTHRQTDRQTQHVNAIYTLIYIYVTSQNPEASLQKLRELTSQLVREEEQLSSQIASAGLENVYEPRSQILEYVFSRPAASAAAAAAAAPVPILGETITSNNDEQVQVSSLTVSDSAPSEGHRIRHHHGQANWLLRRLANTPQTRR